MSKELYERIDMIESRVQKLEHSVLKLDSDELSISDIDIPYVFMSKRQLINLCNELEKRVEEDQIELKRVNLQRDDAYIRLRTIDEYCTRISEDWSGPAVDKFSRISKICRGVKV